ncbi:MAG TPA: hypothetical protein VK508_12670 [Cyclobacteriaceae bacterium]|nr:hypothetical protein [Cyclobacteriaceae bacterium]
MFKSRILYNCSYRELKQIPDNEGKCRYESYWKIDIVFKKISGPLEEFVVSLTPQSGAIVVKFAVGSRTAGTLNDNQLTVSRKIYKKGERLNVDCFLAECHGNRKSFMTITLKNPKVALLRWPPLKIKKGNGRIFEFIKVAWKYTGGTIIRYTIRAIFNS